MNDKEKSEIASACIAAINRHLERLTKWGIEVILEDSPTKVVVKQVTDSRCREFPEEPEVDDESI